MPHDIEEPLRNGTRTMDAPPQTQKNEIVVYQPDETLRLETRYADESIWLPQLQIAKLFGVQKAAISKHLKNIYATGELERAATVSKMETVQTEGGRTVVRLQEFFNLDVIIAVGYRVNSSRATQFRIWATQVLKNYLLRGYAINQRLNLIEDKTDRRFAEHDRRLTAMEEKVDFFVRTQTPPLQGVFFDGQLWDARAFVDKLVKSARRSLLLVDHFSRMPPRDSVAGGIRRFSASLGPSLLRERRALVPVVPSASRLAVLVHRPRRDAAIPIRPAPAACRRARGRVSRFGASLKDLGKKCFGFTKMDPAEIPGLKARL